MSAPLEFETGDSGQGSVLAPPANQFVTFSADNKGYGVDIMAVREIRSWSPTTELPDGSYSACGVLDIRGTVVEVHDLSAMLGGQRLQAEPGHVVLVVSLGDTNVGILVDSVSDIIFAKDEEFRAAPNTGGDPSSAKVSRLVRQEDRLIAILNLPALFPMVSMH
tara:strand:- start:586 stop:1077 length:492 start_codon:yes stop_codon:yes gene_type:complete